MASSPVKFGLIGFGAWGSHHANAIAATEGAELSAITAKSAATRESARKQFPTAVICESIEELVSRPELDAVDIVLPSYLHAEVAERVLKAGKHLLLEKPMAITVADCQRLIDLAASQERLVAIGHEFRLSSLWGRAKEIIAAGTIGTPQYVLVELSRRPYRLGADGWRFDINRVGDWILEEPIHFFDLARWYLSDNGEPVSVYASASARDENRPELQDNFSAIVNFPHNAFAVISQTLGAFEHHQTVKVTGSKGALVAKWSGDMDRTRHPQFSLRVFDGENLAEEPITKITGEVYELEDQMAMLTRAIRGGKPLAATGNDGMWSVAMCLAAQRSVQQAAPVEIAEMFQ